MTADPRTQRPDRVALSIGVAHLERLDMLAAHVGITRSELIRRWIDRAVAELSRPVAERYTGENPTP